MGRQWAKLLFQKAGNLIHGHQFPSGEHGSSGGHVGTNSSSSCVMSLSKSGVYGEFISYLVRAFLLFCNLRHGFARFGMEEDDIANASRRPYPLEPIRLSLSS